MTKKTAPYLLLFLFCILSNAMVMGQSASDKKKLEQNKKALQKEIEQNRRLLSETKKNKQVSLNKLIILNNQIRKREALIKTASAELSIVINRMFEKQRQVEALKAELAALKSEYAEMLRFAYKNRSSYNRLMFVFASEDFYQAYNRLKYLQQYSEQLKLKGIAIQEKTKQLNETITQLNNILLEKQVLLKEQESEKGKLAKAKTEQNLTYKELQKKESVLLAKLRKKEADAQKLQAAIQAIIAKEIAEAAKRKAAANKSNNKTTTSATSSSEVPLTPEEKILSDQFVLNKGKLPWPTYKGEITGQFGEHPHPVLKGIKTKNNGIDIGTVPGSSARAVFNGTVTGVINIPGSGKAVMIKHGEYWTVYSNLADVTVSMGQKVSTKQDIGLIYTDPADNKTELHFEIWQGKILLNPAWWVTPKK